MSRAADLAPLFRNEPENVGFRQGVVLAWDEATGTNAVDVGGTQLANLPALNIGSFVALQPGDVVGLLRFQSTYFILGRIILPEAPDANRAIVAFDSASGSAENFSLTTSETNRAPAVLNVPSWADEAIIQAGVTAQAKNSTASTDYMQIQAVSGPVNVSPGPNYEANAGFWATGCVYGSALLTATNGDFTPGGTITVHGQIFSSFATWAADPLNFIQVDATAIFRRVD